MFQAQSHHYDTQSEAESSDNLSSVLVDSEREISRLTGSLDLYHAEGGFVRPDCYNQYVSCLEISRFSFYFHDNTMCFHQENNITD